MKKLSLLILVACCVGELSLAQDGQRAPRTGNGPGAGQAATSPAASQSAVSSGSNVAGSSAGVSATGGRQSAIGSSTSGRQSTGRQLSRLKPLRTQSGSMPGFMQRAGLRNSNQTLQSASEAGGPADRNGLNSRASNQRGAQQNPNRNPSQNPNANLSSAGNQQNLQQVFLNNALLFDENSDNQLAANELRNLFILLISENNQNNYYGYGNGFGFGNGNRIVGGTRYDQANQNSRNQGYQGAQFFGTAPNVQGSSLEEAILLFLLLTLRFDTNGDGGLNPAEIQQFATALLNNELNLNQAANQLPQRR